MWRMCAFTIRVTRKSVRPKQNTVEARTVPCRVVIRCKSIYIVIVVNADVQPPPHGADEQFGGFPYTFITRSSDGVRVCDSRGVQVQVCAHTKHIYAYACCSRFVNVCVTVLLVFLMRSSHSRKAFAFRKYKFGVRSRSVKSNTHGIPSIKSTIITTLLHRMVEKKNAFSTISCRMVTSRGV